MKEFSLYDSDNEMTEEQLVLLSKQGDSVAFSRLVIEYHPLIKKRAGQYSNTGVDTEDLEQEGMIGLLKAVRAYNPQKQASFKTFAVLCINHKMLSAVKSYNRNKHLPMRGYFSLSMPYVEEQFSADTLIDQGDPQVLFIKQEELLICKRQIETLLSRFEQDALKLYLSSVSYQEMATQLHSTTKAVDNALQRVRRKLRNVF